MQSFTVTSSCRIFTRFLIKRKTHLSPRIIIHFDAWFVNRIYYYIRKALPINVGKAFNLTRGPQTVARRFGVLFSKGSSNYRKTAWGSHVELLNLFCEHCFCCRESICDLVKVASAAHCAVGTSAALAACNRCNCAYELACVCA